MINGKTVIGVIPARGGSKGLVGKNTKELCGQPLINWTIERGLQSEYLDELIVTTDSEDIAKVAQERGATVPFIRHSKLATDTSSTFSTVEHVLDYYKCEQGREFDYVALLEPTSPLRETDDIDKMLKILERHDASHDAIVSVGEVTEHPSVMKQLEGQDMTPFCNELVQTNRRQDNQPAFFPYGVAYIVKSSVLLKEKTFYPKKTTYFKIKRYQCYEIDDIYDFISIQAVMKREWGLK